MRNEKNKTYKVEVFILGTPPEWSHETRFINAPSEKEAEYEATHGISGEGWGVLSTKKVNYREIQKISH